MYTCPWAWGTHQQCPPKNKISNQNPTSPKRQSIRRAWGRADRPKTIPFSTPPTLPVPLSLCLLRYVPRRSLFPMFFCFVHRARKRSSPQTIISYLLSSITSFVPHRLSSFLLPPSGLDPVLFPLLPHIPATCIIFTISKSARYLPLNPRRLCSSPVSPPLFPSLGSPC
jgi:hypothetical protein